MNDSEDELRDMAKFIASVDVDIPWHLTAFYETYKMHGPGATDVETLIRGAEIGKEEGLHYVYVGNVPGYAPDWENTYCPGCKALVVERHGYRIMNNKVQQGKCPSCDQMIAGVWD
jgi:pyruvate formate lyase activating enzyme